MNDVYSLIEQHNIRYRRDCTMADLTTFKIGGRVECVFYPESVEQCQFLISLAKKEKRRLFYLGNGSNILGDDNGFHHWILKTDLLQCIEVASPCELYVGAGVKNVKVSSFAAKLGLSGFEFAHGIPGSIGGAVYMNAGAYGGSMDQVVVETEYLDFDGNLRILDCAAHCFGYRHSFFVEHPEYLIVGCKLRLNQGDVSEINALIADLQNRRKEKQPLEYPSAGSTFKRPEGYFAGKLIQDAGLKGYRVGDAQVSEKHAGFVINRGNASSEEVMQLIHDVQRIVMEKFGVELECEVLFLGAD